MLMKLKKISEAIMFLPGFGPGEDPLAVLPPKEDVIEGRTAEIIPFPVARKAPVVRNNWPRIEALDAPTGPADRIERNLAALRLLKALEEEGREPTTEERNVLHRYGGWGAVPKIFDEAWTPLKDQREALRGLLGTEEAWAAARASVTTAFFTPVEVCDALWSWIQQAGFAGGRILETSAGNGLILGTMPEEIVKASTVTAIEKDLTTGRILKALYGRDDTTVHVSGFEAVELAEGSFDLAVSNVPFGDFGVASDLRGDYRDWKVHDFFFGRAMDLVREGGLVAFLTSSGTLDKSTNSARKWLAARADLIHAVRLPKQAFSSFAGTEATVDIVILRKRAANETPREGSSNWVTLSYGPFQGVAMGRNLGALPDDHFIGDIKVSIGQYGTRTLIADAKGDWRDEVKAAVNRLTLPRCYEPRAEVEVLVPQTRREALASRMKPGAYVLMSGGQIGRSFGLSAEEVTLPKKKAERIAAMIPLRDAARRLVEMQATETDDRRLEVLRVEMGLAYEAFVKAFGPINLKVNVQTLRDDPDFPLLLSLEKWDEETGVTEKADLFYRRTARAVVLPDSAESVAEALTICLVQTGRVVPSHIAKLVRQPVDAVEAALREGGLAFLDPATGRWEAADLYLSGDVKTKLVEAMTAGKEFAANAEALRGVLPEDIAPKDIAVSLGATWIPVSIIEQFAKEVLGAHSPKVSIKDVVKFWKVEGHFPASPKYTTNEKGAAELLALALNQKEPEIRRRDKNDRYVLDAEKTMAACEAQSNIKEAFEQWVMADEARETLVAEAYNRLMNRHVARKIDAKGMVLPGFSNCFTLREHQVNAVWRIVTGQSNTLLAHCVGAGKTAVMACAAMEMRRTGRARKPLIVVPNHMLEQFTAEFLRAYPGASVLAASKDDFDAEGRKTLAARMAAWDWDAIIMTHSSFGKMQASPKHVEAFIKAEILKLRASMSVEDDKVTVKELEAAVARMEKRLTDLSNTKVKDDFLTLEQCGVDALFVDEADLFKNLYRTSRMTRVAGLPNVDSQRAFDMLLKVREIERVRNDRTGVVFATGTPVANSMAELWVMQYYLQHHTLIAMGYDQFDSWAATFGKVVKGLEVRPDGGGYRVNARFAKFTNLPELLAVFGEIADVQTREMLSLPTPITHHQTIQAEGSAALKAYVNHLVKRAEAIKDRKVKPKDDNMLSVTFDGRCAATDMRLVGGEDEQGSKINLCVAKVAEVYKDSTPVLGTQLVFLDISTPTGPGWSLYTDIKAKLVAKGIPEDEVAFVHDAGTDVALAKLFAKVRSGKVRVLLGSTAKMGCGTNVQTRLVALHHIDAPWRPRDVEQREGRIERQGNQNAEVWIYRYVTKGSFDAYMWQCLESKARFIAQVMSGAAGRASEDAELSALSYAEVKALASGNPLVMEKAGVDAEVAKLTVLQRQWERAQSQNRYDARTLPARLHAMTLLAQAQREDAERVEDVRGDKFRIVIGEEALDDRKVANGRLQFLLMEAQRKSSDFKVGRYGGFDIWIATDRHEPSLYLKGNASWEVEVRARHRGPVDALYEALSEISTAFVRTEGRVERMTSDLERARAMIEEGFDKQERLEALLARQAEINAVLGVEEADDSVIDESECTETEALAA